MPFNPASLKNLRRGQQSPNSRSATSARKSARESGENRDAADVLLPALVTENQALAPEGALQVAVETLKATGPAAALHLQRVVTGATRTPPGVRLLAALKVLESQGLIGQQSQQPEQLGPSPALLAKLAEALALRRRAAEAVDVQAVPEA